MKKAGNFRKITAGRLFLLAGAVLAGYIAVGSVLFLRAGTYRTYDPEADVRVYDLVIVFAGDDERMSPALELLRGGRAAMAVVSPASGEEIRAVCKRQFPGGERRFILETRATSTHENAFFSAGIVKREHARRVILVTSFYHMKRAHRLLALALLGTGTEIACLPAYPDGGFDAISPMGKARLRGVARIERVNTALNFLKFLCDGLRIRKSGRLEHALERYYDYFFKERLAGVQQGDRSPRGFRNRFASGQFRH